MFYFCELITYKGQIKILQNKPKIYIFINSAERCQSGVPDVLITFLGLACIPYIC